MIINYLLKQDFHTKYKLHAEDKLFNDVQSLIYHLVAIVNKWSLENTESKHQLPAKIVYSFLLNFHVDLPFVFSFRSEQLLNQISSDFKLENLEKYQLQSLIFNFEIKILIENEFSHKFIRFAFEVMENRAKEFKEFKSSQKDSLAKLSKNTSVPIHELEPLIMDFINSKLSNYPEFKYLNNIEELIKAKKDLFPEIFTTGKPKTIAFNEFIHGLYLLITARNSNYMPFIKYVVDELNQINPKYFERNNISVEALRKKVKDQIKENSK